MRRAALLGVLALAACVHARTKIERPRTEAVSARVEAGADDGLTVVLALTVHNGNDGALALRAVDWQLGVGGRALARGRAVTEVTLGQGATAVEVRAELGAGAAARVREAIAAQGEVALEVSLALHSFDGRGRAAPGSFAGLVEMPCGLRACP